MNSPRVDAINTNGSRVSKVINEPSSIAGDRCGLWGAGGGTSASHSFPRSSKSSKPKEGADGLGASELIIGNWQASSARSKPKLTGLTTKLLGPREISKDIINMRFDLH